MKSAFIAIVLCSTAFGLAAPAFADHKLPRPFGGTGPFRFLKEDIDIEGNPLFDDGFRDRIVGYSFNSDDEDHPWLSSSPTVNISNSHVPPGHDLYVYHSSQLNMTNTIFSGQIFGFNESMIDLVDRTLVINVNLSDSSHLRVRGSSVSLSTHDSSTANISNATGGGISAHDNSKVTIENSFMDGPMFANNKASITIDGGINGGIGTNRNGLVSMIGGEAGGVSALHDGTIELTDVVVDGGLLAGDTLPGFLGSASIAMTGGSVTGGDVIARDRATIVLDNVGGRIDNVFVRDNASYTDLGGPAVISTFTASGSSNTNLSRAAISGQLQINDDARLSMDSTLAGRVFVTGTFTMSGFSIVNDIVATGTVNLQGGVCGRVQVADFVGERAVLNLINARSAGAVDVLQNAQANIIGGSIDLDLTTSFTGQAFLSGGVVGGNLRALGASAIFMSGGHVAGTPQIADTAVLNWSGGTFGLGGGLPSFASANEEVPGAFGGSGAGDPMAGLVALDNGTINIIGFSLVASLVDPNFEGMFSKYVLSGKLADGTQITGGMIFVQNDTGASLHLIEATIPEPTTLAMLIAPAATSSLLRRRRSTKRVSRTR